MLANFSKLIIRTWLLLLSLNYLQNQRDKLMIASMLIDIDSGVIRIIRVASYSSYRDHRMYLWLGVHSFYTILYFTYPNKIWLSAESGGISGITVAGHSRYYDSLF